MKTPSLQPTASRDATIADRAYLEKSFLITSANITKKAELLSPPPTFFPAAADFMARTDVSQPPATPVRNHPAAQRHSRR